MVIITSTRKGIFFNLFFILTKKEGEKMSEKNLLYIEDALAHLEYFKRHLGINGECLSENNETSLLKKFSKKTDRLYTNFYDLLKGE